jgi:hypothetical protein
MVIKSFSLDVSSASTGKLAGMQKENLWATVKSQWLRALCGMPQAIWLWHFGNVTGPAPCTSRAATTCFQTSAPYSQGVQQQQPSSQATTSHHPQTAEENV